MKESDFIKLTAVIAEYNPFHNGHNYLLRAAHKTADGVLTVMSGNWVQRGDTAVLSKFARTRAALEGGADIVAELPTYYAMSTAQKFAEGAVEIAVNLGANSLIFGSESGDADSIVKAARCLAADEFKIRFRELLQLKLPPAKARETAVEELCGLGYILRSPNDNLAVEYVRAAGDAMMTFTAVKRVGAMHDGGPEGQFCSAGYLRKLIRENDIDATKDFMPKASFTILKAEYEAGKISDISLLEKAILAALRTLPLESYQALPDVSEGLEHRLFRAAALSPTFNALLESAAAKRYTNARLRRLILAAFLGERTDRIPAHVPYIRILGCSDQGLEILKESRKQSKIPMILRSSELRGNPVFEFEAAATDVYALSQKNPDPCGREFTEGLIIKR